MLTEGLDRFLAPLLFILAMEGLKTMIKIAKENEWSTGFEVARSGERSLEECHLQYADDTFFCEAEEEQVIHSNFL